MAFLGTVTRTTKRTQHDLTTTSKVRYRIGKRMPVLFNHAAARIHRHKQTRDNSSAKTNTDRGPGDDSSSNENNEVIMGKTVNRQAQAKQELDRKLALSAPTRELLEELAVACVQDPTPHAKFQYAFALSKSSEPSELRYAVTILDGLVSDGYEHQVDCMYGAATALYLLGDHQEARVRHA
jgi:hypothetical protein